MLTRRCHLVSESKGLAPAHSAESDPRRALRTLIERGEGMSTAATMLRLMWLRREHPEADVSTDVVAIEDNMVVIRAAISLETGAAGSGISAAHLTDEREWTDVVERTETIAIARALDTLGYVLEASVTRDPVQTAPPARPAQPEAEPAPPQAEPAPATEAEPEPAPVTSAPVPRDAGPTPPIVDALRRANRRPAAPGASAAAAAQPAPAEDDDHLEDYSWTAFWSRARELGLDRAAIEARLERPVQGLSPRQLRVALEQAGVDFGGSSEG
jgi:hypothetical protein